MVTSMYTGPDGLAHYRNKPMPTNKAQEAQGVVFTTRSLKGNVGGAPGTQFNSWHNEPVERYIITLSGRTDMMVGDDTNPLVKSFEAGDIALMETKGGKGHRTRTAGDKDTRWMFLELTEPEKK